jgi:DNA-binding CsgD family transcriptional regulator
MPHGLLRHAEVIGVIIEPAAPTEVAILLGQAHGLSTRESQICALVGRGSSTTMIARQLGISPYTVQDHLKSIFDKTVVHSRRELISQILFEEHWPHR